MIPDKNFKGNIARFSGFTDCYDKYRPEAPPLVIDILSTYLGKRPSVVVDIGSGTGLSTFVWKDHADLTIGIEPNNDMLEKAREKQQHNSTNNIQFVCGYSNQTGLESNFADIITCSQSFHWMEPTSTLAEISRVLSDSGVFAAYDCDWPPIINWEIESAFAGLVFKAGEMADKYTDTENRVRMWSKGEQLKNMIESNLFRYCREVVFHNTERCDADRFIGIALSQGVLQTAVKIGSTDIDMEFKMFCDKVKSFFKDRTLDILFSYRMRLGVK
jgi:ubiquinone/menaquinone biosynthesis C-methylase UbiE